MDIAAAQLLYDRLGRLDRIDLVTDPTRPVEEVRRAVHALLPPGLTVKRPQQRNAQIERMTRAFRLNVSILSVVALLVGLFLVYNTVSFAVLRRRREIGILRSLGLSSAGIVRLLLTEVVLVGIVGGSVGIGFGVALSNGVLQTLAATVSNLYYQSLVAPRLTWVSSDVLVQGLLIGVVVAVVGSLGPIREAVTVEPTQALAPGGYELVGTVRIATVLTRAMAAFLLAGLAALQDPVQGLPLFGYVAVFLVVLGFALLSPVVIGSIAPCLRMILPRQAGCLPRLAAAELERAPVRNAVAVSALMVGLALMIGVSVMIHSFRQTVDLWLEQTVKADLIVAPPTWLGDGPEWALPESVHQRLQALPGVVAAGSYRDGRHGYRGRTVRGGDRDVRISAQHCRHVVIRGGSPRHPGAAAGRSAGDDSDKRRVEARSAADLRPDLRHHVRAGGHRGDRGVAGNRQYLAGGHPGASAPARGAAHHWGDAGPGRPAYPVGVRIAGAGGDGPGSRGGPGPLRPVDRSHQ